MLNLNLKITEEMLDLVNVGFYIFQDDQFKYVNKEISKITGYSKEELLSANPYEFLAEEKERDRIREFTRLALLGKFENLPCEHSVKIVKKDGSTGWVTLRPLPVIYNGKRAIICSVFDITDAKAEKQRKEELEKFLGLINKIVRHDLINKLSAAISYLDLFMESKGERFVESALRSLEEGIEILQRMKDLEYLARSGKEERTVSLKHVFERVASNYDVEVAVFGDCSVVADDGMYSVADNLIGNAVKHGKCSKIDVTITRKGKKCEVKVTDNGIGIPEDVRNSIFDEGFSQGGGTGLGLFIVKKLIEKYGGEIRVESNIPQGVAFTITLNVSEECSCL
ncbi:PAS domain-containing sensor histidine kinase [Archaeoglobus sp.]